MGKAYSKGDKKTTLRGYAMNHSLSGGQRCPKPIITCVHEILVSPHGERSSEVSGIWKVQNEISPSLAFATSSLFL